MTRSTVPLSRLSRRALLLGGPLALAGCTTSRRIDGFDMPAFPALGPFDPTISMRYGEIEDNGRIIEAIDLNRVDRRWLRQEVSYSGPERVGTVVVDPNECHLYLVMEGGRALRYGVGVGREGFGWSGRARIARKAVWPTWTPPVEMQQRDPEARKWAGGMPGGIDNPLGARAHYLFQGNVDTIYRIHGTTEPYTIGTRVSSGCVRMFNHDVIDLYNRVPVNTPVVVQPTAVL